MRAEIGEPLQKERRVEREELPPVEGCGYTDPSFDPMAQWRAREASKPAAESKQVSIMPAVEAMPNWRQFVGWLEPSTVGPQTQPQVLENPATTKEQDGVQLPVAKAMIEKPKEPVAQPSPASIGISSEVEDSTIIDLELSGFDHNAGNTLDLGDLDMASVIAAAASAVDEPVAPEPVRDDSGIETKTDEPLDQSTMVVRLDEPEARLDDAASNSLVSPSTSPATDATMVVVLDEPMASLAPEQPVDRKVDLDGSIQSAPSPLRSAPQDLGLSPKLASVRPLAHPGRLPRKFELTETEKEVLRLCDGRCTTQSILESGIGLDGAQLTAFMKRCAQVKLVTFKR